MTTSRSGIFVPWADIPNAGNNGVDIALHEHLAAIVESSNDAIISKDLNGIIRSWNGGAQRIFGYTAEEMIGKPISMLAAPNRGNEIPSILERITRGERIEHYETKRVAKDGRILSISLTISPIRDRSGQIVGASKIARDITERELHQQALREANENLSRLNGDLEQFVYSASHDLQEPLRMVAIYAEMLRRQFGPHLGAVGYEYISNITDGAARMAQLLTDLRAFTRTWKDVDDKPEETDSKEALERALANLRLALRDGSAVITHDELPKVRIRAFQLDQLFHNLISNAVKYRSEEQPRVHIAAAPIQEGWRFSVRDNGIGIDPQYKEQIFGIFKRLHTAAEYPGTGMGLAICQRIVEQAGGRIWVESEVGCGSTFFFTIPF